MTDSEKVLTSMFGRAEDGVFSGTVANERNMRVKYWRKPDGWITTGPDWRTDSPKAVKYRDSKGYKELPDSYGLELINKGDITATKRRQGFEHWWLKPFMDAGGLTYRATDADAAWCRPGEYLMPAEQIVALGLHRFDDVKNARPDLAEAVDLECPYACTDGRGKRRLFSGMTKDIAQISVDQHVVAVHKDAIASRAVGETIANAMKDQGGANADTIAAIVAAVVQALNPVEKAVVASMVPPVEPEAQPEPELVQSDFPDENWQRRDLISFASKNGLQFPDRWQAMNRDEWLRFILDNTEDDSSPVDDVDELLA